MNQDEQTIERYSDKRQKWETVSIEADETGRAAIAANILAAHPELQDIKLRTGEKWALFRRPHTCTCRDCGMTLKQQPVEASSGVTIPGEVCQLLLPSADAVIAKKGRDGNASLKLASVVWQSITFAPEDYL